MQKLYSGPTNPRTGKRFYPGFYPGGEMGWAANTVINQTKKSGVSSYDFWGHAFYHKADWPYPVFDFDKDVQRADEELGPITNATSPNLDEFRTLGHKLIYYHGAADPLIPAQNGVEYFDTVVAMQKGLIARRVSIAPSSCPGSITAAEGRDRLRSARRSRCRGRSETRITKRSKRSSAGWKAVRRRQKSSARNTWMAIPPKALPSNVRCARIRRSRVTRARAT